MTEPLLLLDTNYLCHRAWHAMGEMHHAGQGTAAIFGVLSDIVHLQDEFRTSRIAFAFDGSKGLRYQHLPGYKAARRKRREIDDAAQKEARADLREQIRRLQEDYLPAMGFRNIWSCPGYEGDDIIAQAAAQTAPGSEAIIIASDQDLWQCLRPGLVWQYNPTTKQAMTYARFKAAWGIEPPVWATVKAMAGCSSDSIPGVKGVGEKTAAKFIRGELGEKTKAHAAIKSFSAADRKRNKLLTTLPFPGTPEPVLQEDHVTEDKWAAMADRLGMTSLKKTPPRCATRKSRGRRR